MFYNDAVMGVVIFSGVYASGTFGWDATSMLLLGLCTTASAMLGVYLGGLLDDKLGSLVTLRLVVVLATLTLLTLVSMQPNSVFFVVSVSTEPVWASPYFRTLSEILYFVTFQVFAALALTSLSASRTFMARISPPEKATQFFGLYGLSGTVTLFLGPLMVASTTDWFQSQQLGFTSLIVLMVIGTVLLFRVKQEQSMIAPNR
jgi:UMF1 family MFS transporter